MTSEFSDVGGGETVRDSVVIETRLVKPVVHAKIHQNSCLEAPLAQFFGGAFGIGPEDLW
jgi:hypothetical protein